MSGNVWEWTRSLWGSLPTKRGGNPTKSDYNYPYEPKDARREDLEAPDEVMRVLRGGFFSCYEVDLRAASRGWGDPVYPNSDVGFRVVSSRLRS